MHHHPAQRADPPVRLQGEAEQAVAVLFVVAAQFHFQVLAKAHIQANVPVLDIQLPAHRHPAFIGMRLHQAPLAFARPAVLRPAAFGGMAAEPRPADRNAATDRRRAQARPIGRAPQQGAFALGLEMQELCAATAEHCLAHRMIDEQ
ncbi:hypothetical protein D3C80_1697160 [compost metagenome]